MIEINFRMKGLRCKRYVFRNEYR